MTLRAVPTSVASPGRTLAPASDALMKFYRNLQVLDNIALWVDVMNLFASDGYREQVAMPTIHSSLLLF